MSTKIKNEETVEEMRVRIEKEILDLGKLESEKDAKKLEPLDIDTVKAKVKRLRKPIEPEDLKKLEEAHKKSKKSPQEGNIIAEPVRQVSQYVYTEQILHRWKNTPKTILYVRITNGTADVYYAGLVICGHEVAKGIGPDIESALRELNNRCKMLVIEGTYDTWNY